ncbi:MAG: hypothetical protein WAV73_04055 [Candidatus Moraniibacteriota bacterium]
MKKDRKTAEELHEDILRFINERFAHRGPLGGDVPFFQFGMRMPGADCIPPGMFDDRDLGGVDECSEKPGRQIVLEFELNAQKDYAKKLSDEVVHLAEKVRSLERAMDDAETATDEEHARLESLVNAKEEELSMANAAAKASEQAAFDATQKAKGLQSALELTKSNLRAASNTNGICMILIDDARKILRSGKEPADMIQQLTEILLPKSPSGAETANMDYDNSGEKTAVTPPCGGGCACKKIKIDGPEAETPATEKEG